MKTLFGCDYCAFSSDIKGLVSFHEGACIKNPNHKTCFSCEHHLVEGIFDEPEYICDKGVSPHIRMDCEDGVVNCEEYQDKR